MALPISELRNWGEELSDSDLEKDGEPTSGIPVLFPTSCSGEKLRGPGGAWSQGLGEQRLSKQALRSPTQGGLTP